MFGHDDHKKDEDQHDDEAGNNHSEKVIAPVDDQAPGDSGGNDWQHPGTPIDDGNKTDDFTVGQPDDGPDDDSTDTDSTRSNPPSAPFSTTADATPQSDARASNHDLIDIKQEALGKLSPLIGHLDQAPEEKFRTLMMMIQASDDQALVKQAYDTALEIEDEKTRAQALLDIVNEINYFTQNPKAE